jgi:hypothetical protein
MPSLPEIIAIASLESVLYGTLSAYPSTLVYAMYTFLSDYNNWSGDGDTLTDSEKDFIDEIVARLYSELGLLEERKNAMYVIQERQILTVNAPFLRISDLPPDYAKIIIDVRLRSNRAVLNDNCMVTINDDTDANNYQNLLFASSAVTPAAATQYLTGSQAGWFLANSVPGNTATAERFSQMTMELTDYAVLDTAKTMLANLGVIFNNVGGNQQIRKWNGVWLVKTEAISEIKITATSGSNFVPGTTWAVYGVGLPDA